MFVLVDNICLSPSNNLRVLMEIAEGFPETFYCFSDLDDVDLRGQDLRGINFTGCNFRGAHIDNDTILDEQFHSEGFVSAYFVSFIRAVIGADQNYFVPLALYCLAEAKGWSSGEASRLAEKAADYKMTVYGKATSRVIQSGYFMDKNTSQQFTLEVGGLNVKDERLMLRDQKLKALIKTISDDAPSTERRNSLLIARILNLYDDELASGTRDVSFLFATLSYIFSSGDPKFKGCF